MANRRVWVPPLWSGPMGPLIPLRRARDAGGGGGGTGLLSGLVSYWKLDEASGTREDIHGANDLTESGSVASAAGKINDAAVLTTNPDYLTIASPPASFQGGATFTVSFWFNRASGTGDSILLACGNGTDGWFIRQRTSGSRLVTFSMFSGTNLNSSGVTISNGTWYHVIATYDAAAGMRLVLNGNVSTNAVTGLVGGVPFLVGGDDVIGNSINASVDEMGLWSRVLTTDEEAALYGAGTPPAYDTFT